MKAGFMVACEYAGQLASGAPIIVGIFRQMHVSALPASMAPFFLALELEAEPYESGDHVLELRLIDEDGQVLYEMTLASQFRHRADMGPNYSYFAERVFVTEPIRRPGTYRFDLSWRNEVLAQLRLEVVAPS